MIIASWRPNVTWRQSLKTRVHLLAYRAYHTDGKGPGLETRGKALNTNNRTVFSVGLIGS